MTFTGGKENNLNCCYILHSQEDATLRLKASGLPNLGGPEGAGAICEGCISFPYWCRSHSGVDWRAPIGMSEGTNEASDFAANASPQIEGSVHMTQTDRLHDAHTGKQTSERRILGRTGNKLRSSSQICHPGSL